MNIENSKAVHLPLLPLRGLVILPRMTLNFDVGRKKSAAALASAMNTSQRILLVSQRDIETDEPTPADLYNVGCVAKIHQMLRLPDGTIRVIAEGLYRAEVTDIADGSKYMVADAVRLEDYTGRMSSAMRETLVRKLKLLFEKFAAEAPKLAPDIALTISGSNDPSFLSDYITFNLVVPDDDKQFVLELTDVAARARTVMKMLERERQIQHLDKSLSEKVRFQIDENQKEYYLREQIRAINSELYGVDEDNEVDEYLAKIGSLNAPDSVKERLTAEAMKLSKMPQGSHEGTVSRIFLDTCLELPWNCVTKDKTNIANASRILDRDFYGLTKVKDRMLELISVYKMNPDIKGQIICLAGPPGVGKTNIAKTIAECMGRRYARVALGGVHDEAEIRGHRKTYIGAMPGRIIDAVKRAGSSNPLILLDEVDKLGADYKGDPANALLEVLDPEQNSTFTDHFIDMPYDLGHVLFIATANDVGAIPEPLLDRLELIELSGYTENEKLAIAKRHLVKKELAKHGLDSKKLKFTDSALNTIIDSYTREAGVRELQRNIGSVCRKAVKLMVEGKATKITVTADTVREMLGTPKYHDDFALRSNEVGVINGLAWTAAGGKLMGLEVLAVDGTGKIELTGSLGDVMKESAKTAITCVRSRAEKLRIDPDFYKTKDIHIHATESAIPKDGPSAGVTIASALISALTYRAVRHDVALTGEISIRGRVFPIGGLKEKSMAAMRNGITTVLIPYDNIPDLDDVDDEVKKFVRFIPCKTIDDVLEYILEPADEVEQVNVIPDSKETRTVIRQ